MGTWTAAVCIECRSLLWRTQTLIKQPRRFSILAVFPEFIKRPLRYRSLLLRPAIIRELTKIAENEPSFGNRCTIFHSGDALYGSMIEHVERAEIRVYCEFYMFLSDRTAWRFAEKLAEKAREGVEVRVIYDAIGSLNSDSEVFEFMESHGVSVLEYRPIAPWKRRFGVFGRDHRKVLVIDDHTAYLGGFNLGDYWS